MALLKTGWLFAHVRFSLGLLDQVKVLVVSKQRRLLG